MTLTFILAAGMFAVFNIGNAIYDRGGRVNWKRGLLWGSIAAAVVIVIGIATE